MEILWKKSSVQLSRSVMSDSWQPHEHSLSITNSQSSAKPLSIESAMPSSHLILCCPLLLPSVFPRVRVFSKESVLRIRWPEYWSFIFSISPNEYSGLISFRMIASYFLCVHFISWTRFPKISRIAGFTLCHPLSPSAEPSSAPHSRIGAWGPRNQPLVSS